MNLLLSSRSNEDMSVIFLIPLWYNPVLRIPLKPLLSINGISIISDILSEYSDVLSLEDLQGRFDVNRKPFLQKSTI